MDQKSDAAGGFAVVEPNSFDSSANVAHIHGGPRDGEPPGGKDLEVRVAKLESDLTDIRVMLGRIDERLIWMSSNQTTKADLAETERRVSDKIASVDVRVGVTEGELRRTLGVWQFLGVMIAVVAFIVKWPTIADMVGLSAQ